MKLIIFFLCFFYITSNAFADIRQAAKYYKNKEYEKALEEFHKLTDNSDPAIFYQIGYMYWIGQGTEKNRQEAIKWFKKTIIKGQDRFPADKRSQSALKLMEQVDASRLKKTFVKQAYSGVAEATYALGALYFDGVENRIAKDVVYAVYWFKQAAQNGNANAQWQLTKMYTSGTHLEKNDEKAFFYTRNAAKQDNSDAQLLLAVHYKQGIATDIDLVKSLEWTKKSVANGNETAKKFLNQFFPNEKSIADVITPQFNGEDRFGEIDLKVTIEKALAGDQSQQFLLGLMYTEGKGVKKNIEQGKKWLRLAADEGNQFAASFLADRYMSGTLYEKDYAIAAKYYEIAALAGDPALNIISALSIATIICMKQT